MNASGAAKTVIPEIGHFALILALSLALCQGVLPLLGAHRNDQAMLNVAKPAAVGQFVFIVIAFVCLTWSFIQSDFSVLYVANHSQLSLPIPYKISAVWGAHEGSLLAVGLTALGLDRIGHPLQQRAPTSCSVPGSSASWAC